LAMLIAGVPCLAMASPITFVVRLQNGDGVASRVTAASATNAVLPEITVEENDGRRSVNISAGCNSTIRYLADPVSNHYIVQNNPQKCSGNQVVFRVKRRQS
jgi:hypothetical protein